MTQGTTIYDVHGRLLRDAFLLFACFHYYQIELDGPFLTDRPNMQGGDLVHAETQRGCAEALASLGSGCDDERSHYAH